MVGIAVLTPILAQMRDESLSQDTSEIKVQVGKVIVGYVGSKGSIEKAARDLIK